MSAPLERKSSLRRTVKRTCSANVRIVGNDGLPGRDLERLVAVIEAALGEVPLALKSPEHVLGRNSGVIREVDISLRGRFGSVDVFVMIECRDRKRPATVEWIDAVLAKADDVGASVAVVVSPAGFSDGADEYARRRGVATRVLERLAPSEVLEWVATALGAVTVDYRRAEIKKLSVDLAGGDDRDIEPIPGSPPAIAVEATVFRRKADHSHATISDAWRLIDSALLHDGTGPERRRVTVAARFRNPDERFQVCIHDEWWDVEAITFVADVWVESVECPLTRFRYQGEDEVLTEGLGWEMCIDGVERMVALTRLTGGDTATLSLTVEPVEPTMSPIGEMVTFG